MSPAWAQPILRPPPALRHGWQRSSGDTHHNRWRAARYHQGRRSPLNIAGTYQINFVVPAGVQGNAPIVLTAGANSSSSEDPKNPVTIPLFGISYISNNACFAGPGTTTPGTIVSVFGNGFGTTSTNRGLPRHHFLECLGDI